MLRPSRAAGDDVHAEQRSLAELAGSAPRGSYLGASATFVEATLARAAAILVDAVPVPARAEESR